MISLKLITVIVLLDLRDRMLHPNFTEWSVVLCCAYLSRKSMLSAIERLEMIDYGLRTFTPRSMHAARLTDSINWNYLRRSYSSQSKDLSAKPHI